MNVLVAGGAGFIGSHIVDTLLEANANGTILDNMVSRNSDYIRSSCSPSRPTLKVGCKIHFFVALAIKGIYEPERFITIHLNRYTPQLCCGWDKSMQPL